MKNNLTQITESDWNIGYNAAMEGSPCPEPHNEEMAHGHTAGEETLRRIEIELGEPTR